jgi:drug/metabolite transporter (DMT)-like permease
MTAGVLFALAAGLMWGLVFIAPVLLPEYPATLLAMGRYLAFGLIALPLAWLDRDRLRQLSRADWVEALRLALIGNLLYYVALAAAIQRAGAPLPTMIIGTLPVVIALASNWGGERAERLAWGRLGPSLLLIAVGMACVNHAELQHGVVPGVSVTSSSASLSLSSYGAGVALALVALVCWTIYPIRNARWLRQHRERSPSTWATAQGLATLPLALVGYALVWGWMAWWGGGRGFTADGAAFPMPWGPRAWHFVGLMVAIGLFASWLGTLCWNEASQRLPPALSGQLIVFETLAALGYALALRGQTPSGWTLAGAVLLVLGVVWALRGVPLAAAATAPQSTTSA